MKVLFVCRSNVGRSQMAMELYNRIHPGDAASAGTKVNEPGQAIIERPRATNAIAVMKELGIDMSRNQRTPLTPELMDAADTVVVMAEAETTPGYVYASPKTVIWDIVDPAEMNLDDTRQIRDLIASKVQELTPEK